MKALIFGSGSDMCPPIAKLFDEAILPELVDVEDILAVINSVGDTEPDVVINLAGVSYLRPLAESGLLDLFSELNINLVGSFNIAYACAQNKIKTMIFIGSVAGFHGKANHAGYCASKAGVHSLVQSLAAEGHNAYAIAPGRVDTKMREKDYPGEDKKTRLTVEQIAQVVQEIIDGMYKPGDIIVIRKTGYETKQWTYSGEPWRKELKITPWEKPSGF